MKKPPISAFNRWFQDQFGRLPNTARRLKLFDQIAVYKHALVALQEELDCENRLQAQYLAARYAATAARKNFED